ncbi:MAG: PsbP-related protein [Methanobacterium sp.]
MKFKQGIGVIVLILIMMAGMLSGCGNNSVPGGSTDSDHKQGAGQESGKLVLWSNDALKVSFLYPEDGKITINPNDSGGSVWIDRTANTVTLGFHTILSTDNSMFMAQMKKLFDSRAESEKGYEEYSRKFYEVDGYPAAFIDFKSAEGSDERRYMELFTMKGNYEYDFSTDFAASSDDAKTKAVATEIINSFHLLKGMANHKALGVKESGKLVKWSNQHLKVSFLYPQGDKISIKNKVVSIAGLSTKVCLNISDGTAYTDSSMFKRSMEGIFNSMAKSENGFQEYSRKFYEVDGCPAAFLDYKVTTGNEDIHKLMLSAIKDGCFYTLQISFSSADDTKYKKIATEIIDSFHFMKGQPNLNTLKGN